jgi:very-short-patch-repair endonuclease
MTKEERRLWYDFLRDYPVRFMRQRPIDRYIVDFYCSKALLAIELDGSQHYDENGLRKDSVRDADLARVGVKVLRIPNSEVNQNFPGVCEYIDIEVKKRLQR